MLNFYLFDRLDKILSSPNNYTNSKAELISWFFIAEVTNANLVVEFIYNIYLYLLVGETLLMFI